MLTIYQKNSCLLIFLSLLVACDFNNPSHKPDINGDIAIFIDKRNKLCFYPKFETSHIFSEAYDLDSIINVFMYLEEYDIALDSQSSRVLWEDKWYGEVYRAEPICTIDNYQNLINPNTSYIICMRGFENIEKMNVLFCQEFFQKENEIIVIGNNI